MRIFIQRRRDLAVWGQVEQWARDTTHARTFRTVQEASRLCSDLKLEGCEIVVQTFEDRPVLRLAPIKNDGRSDVTNKPQERPNI